MNYAPLSLHEQKRRLRAEMRTARQKISGDKSIFYNQLADVFIAHIQLEESTVIASTCAFRDEMDPAILAEKLRKQGHPIVLPAIIGKREALAFRVYEQADKLIANIMGILEPAVGTPEKEPDVLLVPLLAFDRNRNRLGYGGGYYDRTIAQLRKHKKITTIGIAYACQEVEAVPVGPYDVPLDKIVTEVNVY